MSLRISCVAMSLAFMLLGAAVAQAQPTHVAAVHRSGQTFITWDEEPGADVRYHVYRHTEPIYEDNIDQAQRLTSQWGPLDQDSSVFWSERTLEVPSTSTYQIRDLENGGRPLSEEKGLFVWTADRDGTYYYAVTSVKNGVEDRQEFLGDSGNTADQIVEHVADPAPVLASRTREGYGYTFTQYLDYSRYNPTFGVGSGRPDDTEDDYRQQYAFNYTVATPEDQCGPGPHPVYLYLHGWGGRYGFEDQSGLTPYHWCSYAIYVDDPNQTWYFGHSTTYDFRQGGTPNTGPIANYTEERILRSVYDTMRDGRFNVDPERVYAFGHSMGGSGTVALALRYPNVFATAYASEPMTDYRLSEMWRDDVAAKWGSVASDLPTRLDAPGNWGGTVERYQGQGVWSWQNHLSQVVARRQDQIAPLSFAHGIDDGVIDWATEGRGAVRPFYQGKAAFTAGAYEEDHHWLGFGGSGPTTGSDRSLTPFAGFEVVKSESVPAFGYPGGGIPAESDEVAEYNTHLGWSASWDPWDGAPTDTVNEWRMSLRTDGFDFDPGAGERYTATVDLTPRRLQAFELRPGGRYRWENRRVSDGVLVQSGDLVAGEDCLATVPQVEVTPAGNRLRVIPTGDQPGVDSCLSSPPFGSLPPIDTGETGPGGSPPLDLVGADQPPLPSPAPQLVPRPAHEAVAKASIVSRRARRLLAKRRLIEIDINWASATSARLNIKIGSRLAASLPVRRRGEQRENIRLRLGKKVAKKVLRAKDKRVRFVFEFNY